MYLRGFPSDLMVKNLPAMQETQVQSLGCVVSKLFLARKVEKRVSNK